MEQKYLFKNKIQDILFILFGGLLIVLCTFMSCKKEPAQNLKTTHTNIIKK